jgi:hypothetical protein
METTMVKVEKWVNKSAQKKWGNSSRPTGSLRDPFFQLKDFYIILNKRIKN